MLRLEDVLKKPSRGLGTKPPILATFYDLKVTFWYIGESPENVISKYT